MTFTFVGGPFVMTFTFVGGPFVMAFTFVGGPVVMKFTFVLAFFSIPLKRPWTMRLFATGAFGGPLNSSCLFLKVRFAVSRSLSDHPEPEEKL